MLYSRPISAECIPVRCAIEGIIADVPTNSESTARLILLVTSSHRHIVTSSLDMRRETLWVAQDTVPGSQSPEDPSWERGNKSVSREGEPAYYKLRGSIQLLTVYKVRRRHCSQADGRLHGARMRAHLQWPKRHDSARARPCMT